MTLKGLLAFGFGLIVSIRHYPLIRSSLAVSFGFLVIISGFLIITGSFLHKKHNPRWQWWLIEGSIDILIGAIFVFAPSIAKAFFLYFLSFWAFALGVIQIITAIKMTDYLESWWTLMFMGVLSIVFAVVFFLNPFYTVFRLSLIVGVSCMAFGIILILNSRILRNIYLQ